MFRPLRSAKRKRHSFRPHVEFLEDRTTPSFAAAVNYLVGDSPADVLTADFNNDAKLDLGVVNSGSNSISVLLGNGDGTFQSALQIPTGGLPLRITAADFNNDGKLDLATANNLDISVMLGNGDGTFQPPLSSNHDYVYWYSIASGDLNNDGKADLVLGGDNTDGLGDLRVVVGNGDGTFNATYEIANLGMYVEGITLADFNEDGNTDVATTLGVMFFGNGAGGLAWSSYEGPSSCHISSADLNADGHADLVLTNTNGTETSAFVLGNGDGSFGSHQAWEGSGALAIADIDGDGNLDVVTAGGAMSIMFGNGVGGLARAQRIFPGGNAIALGDFNGDGFSDAAITSSAPGAVIVRVNAADWESSGVSISDVSVAEGNSGSVSANFNVTLSTASTQTISLSYSTNGNSSCVAGVDFVAASGTVTFAPGETSKTVTIDVLGDTNSENHESFEVILQDPLGMLPTPTGLGTILNDDIPSISISDEGRLEGNTDSRNWFFRASLSGPTTEWVTFFYSTSNGTATAGSDYQAASGTFSIAPGTVSTYITGIGVVYGDRLGEPDESFFLNISNPTNATIADSQGVFTIFDDEPRISINDVTMTEGGAGQNKTFTFTVTLSRAYDQAVTVSYQTVNGTATTANNDYVAKSGTITFNPGQTTKTITITVKGDKKSEANEFFYVDLFNNSSNSLINKNRGLGTILNDD